MSTPDRSAIVQQVAEQFPHLLQINTFASCGEFVQRVLAAMPAEGWGHVGKSAGEAGYTAPNGVRFSHDVIWHQPTNQQIDILGYAAANSHPDPVEVEPGPATVSWQVIPPEHYRASNPWLAPVPVQHASPVPVPMPTPDTPCAECAGLKERITNLDGIVEALVERLKVVEDRPAPTPAPLPKRLRLTGSTGGTWRHAHGIDAVFDVEPEG